MTETKKANYAERFVVLQTQFIDGLDEKVITLNQFGAHVVNGETAKLADVIALSHQLAGSCGTFGFETLGEQARQIEQCALALQANNNVEDKQFKTLTQYIVKFNKSVKQRKKIPITFDTKIVTPTLSRSIWLLAINESLSKELELQLSAFGYEVTIFSSVKQCMQQLLHSQPSLIFASVQLPECIKCIFSHTDFLAHIYEKSIAFMLHSNKDEFDLRIAAVRHKAQAFYVSPVDTPTMIGRISELMACDMSTTGRVCIIDDDTLLAQRYALTLESAGIESLVITNVANMVEQILQFNPDLVLLDLNMPNFSGPELAGVIRQYDALKSLSIVYLSAERDEAKQLKAMAYGADDFLNKPISEQQLIESVKIRLNRSKVLRNLIEKDAMTGLLTHSTIQESVEQEFERAKRNHTTLSIVMLDIDHFKRVNDRYGHGVGDVVITTLANMLMQRIRRSDKAGRYGGEEFILVLPECSKICATNIAQTILDNFNTLVFHAGDEKFNCAFSAGVACTAEEFESAEEMFNLADKRLYHAKSNGRNKVESDG